MQNDEFLRYIFFSWICFCSYCLESSLNKTKTKGKVLVCRHVETSTESKVAKSKIVKEAGGVGMILIDETDQDVAIPFMIPSAIVGKKKGEKLLSYIKTTRFVSYLRGKKSEYCKELLFLVPFSEV